MPPETSENGHHLRPLAVEKIGRYAADIAHALHGHGNALQRAAELFHQHAGAEHHAAARGLAAAQRAAHLDGLARDHAGHGVALLHGIGVHDPAHDLRRGVHVRGGDVALRADDGHNHGHKAAREALQFALAQLARVHLYAALGPAVGDVDHGALHRHPRRQRLNLVFVHILMVADAALARPARGRVLHAEALEYAHFAVVHADGQRNAQRALGVF